MMLRLKKFTVFFFIHFLLFHLSVELKASDEIKDSITLTSKKRADRAALMSAILPGAGQIMNKKYWKLPILYGATGAIIYFINVNTIEYKKI